MKHTLYLCNVPIELQQSCIPCKAFGVLVLSDMETSSLTVAKNLICRQIAINDWLSSSPCVQHWCVTNNAIKLEDDKYVYSDLGDVELDYEDVPYSFLSKDGRVYKTGKRVSDVGGNMWDALVPPEYLDDLDLSDRNILLVKNQSALPRVNDFTSVDRILWLSNWTTYNKLINRIKPDWKVCDNPNKKKNDLPF